jgi:hypothetical protein
VAENRVCWIFSFGVAQLDGTRQANADGFPCGALVEFASRFDLGRDGVRLTVLVWKERFVDVMWGASCSLLAGEVVALRDSILLLVRKL